MFVLLVLSFRTCLALINYRYVFKPVLMVLLVATALASYFMNRYGTPIDWSMVQNIGAGGDRAAQASERLALPVGPGALRRGATLCAPARRLAR